MEARSPFVLKHTSSIAYFLTIQESVVIHGHSTHATYEPEVIQMILITQT